jgi:DNA-binding CsgD family transcriptional regulator
VTDTVLQRRALDPLGDGARGWEALFWLVFERSSNAIALVDDPGRVVAVKEGSLGVTDQSRGQLEGTSFEASMRPSERPRSARDWQALLRTGEYAGTRIVLRADESEVEVEFAARLGVIATRRLAIYVVLAKRDARRSYGGGRSQERRLSKREREVITLIALGRETDRIAEELLISTETVRTHVGNAMSKLGAHTRAQLVAIALCTDEAISLPHLQE